MKNSNLSKKPAVQRTLLSDDEAGQRVDNYLHTQLKGIPKSLVYRILRKGEVRINKKRVKPDYRLQAGDEIRLPPLWRLDKVSAPLSTALHKVRALSHCLLYEDEGLLVLNKPSGTAVHGGSGLNFGVIEGVRALRQELPFLELVHRLDRETSGILLIAKKRSILRSLHEQLRCKMIEKTYIALVCGYWPSDYCVVEAPLLKRRLSSGERLVSVDTAGKLSETHFKVLERFPQATLLKVHPMTGRTHQIRVHTQHIGHPIAFDVRYGNPSFDQQLATRGLSNRLFLHAAKIRFNHPQTGQQFVLQAPFDKTLQKNLSILRSHNTQCVTQSF